MVHPIPGQRTGRSVTPRDVLLSYEPSPGYGRGIIDATLSRDGSNGDFDDELRPGLVLAQIAASRKWVPCKRTVTVGADTATAVTVRDARTFRVGDEIKVGSNDRTITEIDYVTNTITVNTSTAWTASDPVFGRGNVAGSETARLILNEFIKTKDDDGIRRDRQFGQAVYSGHVDKRLILGDIEAILADSNNLLNGILWGDDTGQTAPLPTTSTTTTTTTSTTTTTTTEG